MTTQPGSETATSQPQPENLLGASVWQQELYDSLVDHMANENEIIEEYAKFAEETSSATVRYLVNMIVDDERRHHRVLAELANTVRAEATLEEREPRAPFLDVHADPALLKATQRFLDAERTDRDELRSLYRQASGAGGSELEAFMISMLRGDTDRHIRILRFIAKLVRRSPLR